MRSGTGAVVLDGRVEAPRELLRGGALVRRAVVRVEHEVAEAEPVEPAEDGVDGGALLGDEERRLALGRERGDEVDDGLRLAGAGWSLDDEVGTGSDGVDRRVLRRVGVEDEVLVLGVRVGLAVGQAQPDGGERRLVAGERRHDVVVGQGVALQGEVGDHRQLGVGEGAEDEPRCDRELGHRGARVAEGGIYRVGVETVADGGEVGERVAVDLDALLGAEVLAQHRVELDLGSEVDLEVLLGRPVGRSTHERSSTGEAGGRAARGTDHVAIPIATNPAAMPRSSRSSSALDRIARARRRASSKAAGSRTRSDRRVRRPASSIETPPGWAVVRSSVPEGRSRYQSSVLRPPRSTRVRCHVLHGGRHAVGAGVARGRLGLEGRVGPGGVGHSSRLTNESAGLAQCQPGCPLVPAAVCRLAGSRAGGCPRGRWAAVHYPVSVGPATRSLAVRTDPRPRSSGDRAPLS